MQICLPFANCDCDGFRILAVKINTILPLDLNSRLNGNVEKYETKN